jgi:CheY-like chemotaxis protein
VPDTDPARMLDGIRVLVVDDEPDVRELVAAVLDECGAVVTTAPSVEGALEALRQEIPDVLVTDIGMEDGTGYDLIRAVRALPADKGGLLKAVALTAHSTLEDAEAAREAGFNVHLPKPAYPAEMVSLLARLVGR